MSEENVEFLEGLFAGAAEMDKHALLDALRARVHDQHDDGEHARKTPQHRARQRRRGRIQRVVRRHGVCSRHCSIRFISIW